MSKIISHCLSGESLILANNIIYGMVRVNTCWSCNSVGVLPRVRSITISQLVSNAVLVIAVDMTMMKVNTVIIVGTVTIRCVIC